MTTPSSDEPKLTATILGVLGAACSLYGATLTERLGYLGSAGLVVFSFFAVRYLALAVSALRSGRQLPRPSTFPSILVIAALVLITLGWTSLGESSLVPARPADLELTHELAVPGHDFMHDIEVLVRTDSTEKADHLVTAQVRKVGTPFWRGIPLKSGVEPRRLENERRWRGRLNLLEVSEFPFGAFEVRATARREMQAELTGNLLITRDYHADMLSVDQTSDHRGSVSVVPGRGTVLFPQGPDSEASFLLHHLELQFTSCRFKMQVELNLVFSTPGDGFFELDLADGGLVVHVAREGNEAPYWHVTSSAVPDLPPANRILTVSNSPILLVLHCDRAMDDSPRIVAELDGQRLGADIISFGATSRVRFRAFGSVRLEVHEVTVSFSTT